MPNNKPQQNNFMLMTSFSRFLYRIYQRRTQVIALAIFIMLLPIIVQLLIDLYGITSGFISDAFGNTATWASAFFSALAALAMYMAVKFQTETDIKFEEHHKQDRFENILNLHIDGLRSHIKNTKFRANSHQIEGSNTYVEMYLNICDFSKWDDAGLYYKRLFANPETGECRECYYIDYLPTRSPEAKIEQIRKRYERMKEDTNIQYTLSPLFYKFMKALEFVLREQNLNTKERCLYMSLLLDELMNAHQGLLLIYFLCEYENDESGEYLCNSLPFRKMFKDCNLFRYLDIDLRWAAAFDKYGFAPECFVHPSMNPGIVYSLYQDKDSIIHSESDMKKYANIHIKDSFKKYWKIVDYININQAY